MNFDGRPHRRGEASKILHCLQCFDSVGLGVRKSIQTVKIERCMVVCLERGADCLHMVQLMPNPVISCLILIQAGFTFLVPAYPGSPGKEAVKQV